MVVYKQDGYADCHERLQLLLKNFYEPGLISSVEFCTAFVALHLVCNYGSKWICGKHAVPIENSQSLPNLPTRCRLFESESQLNIQCYSRNCPKEDCICLRKNLQLKDFLADKEVKTGIPMETFLLDIFLNYSLRRLPRLVNHFLLNWYFGNRRAILLFRLATYEEVLCMMSEGARVITVLLDLEGLTKIYIDPYEPYEQRDNLSFTIHDMQHLERLFDPAFFYQQVGLFYALKRGLLVNYRLNYKIFESLCLIKKFKDDLHHFVSDMNACIIHMIAFFKAKWLVSFNEANQIEGEDFNVVFGNFFINTILSDFTDTSCLLDPLIAICDKENFTSKHAECLIQFFENIGRKRI